MNVSTKTTTSFTIEFSEDEARLFTEYFRGQSHSVETETLLTNLLNRLNPPKAP